MSLVPRIQKTNHGLTLRRTVIICAFALAALLARYSPPYLSSTSARTAVRSHGNPDRQFFDHEDAQWVAPVVVVRAAPMRSAVPELRSQEPLVEIVTNGLHYDRPPPIA